MLKKHYHIYKQHVTNVTTVQNVKRYAFVMQGLQGIF